MDVDNKEYACYGGHRFGNGAKYVGSWNKNGLRHGFGHLTFSNCSRYDGFFKNGLFHGLGILIFSDGAKYEGEFFEGWFHGYGVFWRCDGMRFEGQFNGGKMSGLGLLTFCDGTNGFPRCEGFFHNCEFVKKFDCTEVVQKAQKVAFTARNNNY